MLKLLLALSLFATPGIALTQGSGKAAVGMRLPTVAVQRLDGAATSMDEWKGKALVVNIWATWCPPCRKEMPALQRLAHNLERDGIEVVALSIDDDANLVREFVLKYGIRFPVRIAASSKEASALLGVQALPLTLLVASDGKVVERVLGERDWADENFAREIRAKLAVSSPIKALR